MEFASGQITLSKDRIDNILSNEGKDYLIGHLDQTQKSVSGRNGCIFRLIDEQEDEEYVIKFLKLPEDRSKTQEDYLRQMKRFEKEIAALKIAKEYSLPNIIEIKFDGEYLIGGHRFPYYVMQKCDCNLREYLSRESNEIDIVQKTILCQKILIGIQGLHDYKMYHRDIKHDNIFFIGNDPYVGDLGLVDHRESDILIDERGELIGPKGWLSPEAMNKFLVENSKNSNIFDCDINELSEVFQLGKLFWYIYQGNLPIGQIESADFLPANADIFKLLFDMLQYAKARRLPTTKVAERIQNFLSTN